MAGQTTSVIESVSIFEGDESKSADRYSSSSMGRKILNYPKKKKQKKMNIITANELQPKQGGFAKQIKEKKATPPKKISDY